MAIYITNDDVRNLLSMEAAVDVLDDLFRQEAAGLVENIPRKRRRFEGGGSGTLMGGVVLGSKAYGVRNSNHSLLHDTDTGALQAVIEPREVAWIRTGAASGVATKYMALDDARVVGCVGTGHQAVTQLRAMCAVRPISLIKVYSRSQERRDAFVKQMALDPAIDNPSIKIVTADSTEACLAGSQIVVAITNSRTPVFDGALLEPGTHVNAAGGNSYARCEVDDVTIRRSSVIAVDNLHQAKRECGELIAAADRGVFRWGQAVELHQVVSGQVAGRPSTDAITLFESQGIGTEDTACYAYLLRQARELGIGTELPF
jgi:ornithine cyclodeaminase/alanine dehydrogenase-like protein (mu-crystallin family)